MTVSTQKLRNRGALRSVSDPSELRRMLKNLLFVPDKKLRSFILYELAEYLTQKLQDTKYPLEVFAVSKDGLFTGFVVCQMDPDYKSYGMKCATFGWIHANDPETCKLLMEACESYAREQGFKKLRGPINYPKYIGGVGYQIMGHEMPLINGIAFNSAEMKEVEFLKQLGYEPESEYSCVSVVQKNWDKGDALDDDIAIRFFLPKEVRALKSQLMDLAKNSFYSVLADAPGGESRLEEMFAAYEAALTYLNTYQVPGDIDVKSYFKIPKFIETFTTMDIVKAVPWIAGAFDINTGEFAGTIMALPNLYQMWKGEKLTHVNVDTVMVKKEYAGRGIFSAINNVGQLILRYRGAEYFEGTTIWSNNNRAIKTIFPHSVPCRRHIVFQKRLLRK